MAACWRFKCKVKVCCLEFEPSDTRALCDSLRMYNGLVERCFKDCVESFRRKDLDSTEEKVRQPALLLWRPMTRMHAAWLDIEHPVLRSQFAVSGLCSACSGVARSS